MGVIVYFLATFWVFHMAVKFKKISVSLPISLVDDLDFVSKSFRCTRSALLTQLLDEAATGLKQICEQHVLPLEESGGDSVETRNAIAATLDRLAGQIESARSAYAKSTKH